MFQEMSDMQEAERLGLPVTSDYLVFRYIPGNGSVFFSATRQGDAVTIHIAADRTGKSKLREAVDRFCSKIFLDFPWCKIIMGVVGPRSVVNLALKCGFHIIGTMDIKDTESKQNAKIVGRWRHEFCAESMGRYKGQDGS